MALARGEAEADTSLAANRPRRAKKKPRMSDDLTPGGGSGGGSGGSGGSGSSSGRFGFPSERHKNASKS